MGFRELACLDSWVSWPKHSDLMCVHVSICDEGSRLQIPVRSSSPASLPGLQSHL